MGKKHVTLKKWKIEKWKKKKGESTREMGNSEKIGEMRNYINGVVKKKEKKKLKENGNRSKFRSKRKTRKKGKLGIWETERGEKEGKRLGKETRIII